MLGTPSFLVTASEAATQNFGFFLGQQLASPVTILLQGELGAGKSVLARGVAYGLGVPREVPITSPTFTLMNHYPARFDFYHFDLYRLHDADELIEIGFDDFAYSSGVALIEWPERLDDLRFDHLLIKIKRLSVDERRIEIQAQGEFPTLLQHQIEQWAGTAEAVDDVSSR